MNSDSSHARSIRSREGKINASQWAITARGFDNLYSTKLLVLMDGRAVYNTSFAGGYWDLQLRHVGAIQVTPGYLTADLRLSRRPAGNLSRRTKPPRPITSGAPRPRCLSGHQK